MVRVTKKVGPVATMIAMSMLVACVEPSAPVPHIQRVERGDNLLTCPQIEAKLAESEALVAQYDTARKRTSAEKATTDTGTTVLAYIPVLGVAAAAGVPIGSQQEADLAQANQDYNDASARRDNLVALGNAANCFGSAQTVPEAAAKAVSGGKKAPTGKGK